jgi:hypothetical protein
MRCLLQNELKDGIDKLNLICGRQVNKLHLLRRGEIFLVLRSRQKNHVRSCMKPKNKQMAQHKTQKTLFPRHSVDDATKSNQHSRPNVLSRRYISKKTTLFTKDCKSGISGRNFNPPETGRPKAKKIRDDAVLKKKRGVSWAVNASLRKFYTGLLDEPI